MIEQEREVPVEVLVLAEQIRQNAITIAMQMREIHDIRKAQEPAQ